MVSTEDERGLNLKTKPYSELGKLLDALARERDIRGPYEISRNLQGVIDYEITGQALSKYLYGKSSPRPAFIKAFAEAFKLTSQERAVLAWTYAYGSKPQDEESALVE
jgi:hypothetical protein